MKTMRFILVFNIFVAVFCSCSTDVDLYAEYKDVPVIYCMLNPRADTNYLKITRAFCGTDEDPINANEVALIYDSSNYPCKLDARIIELESRNNGFGGQCGVRDYHKWILVRRARNQCHEQNHVSCRWRGLYGKSSWGFVEQ